MALSQAQVMVSKDWASLSSAECMVQSLTHTDAQFDVAFAVAKPGAGSTFFRMKFDEPVVFGFKTPVWCRLSDIRRTPNERVNEISVALCVARESV